MTYAVLLGGLALRAVGIYGAGRLTTYLLRKRDAALRNAIWSMVALSMLILPWISWLTPALPPVHLPWTAPLAASAQPTRIYVPSRALRRSGVLSLSPVVSRVSELPRWFLLLIGIYGVGVVLQILQIATAVRRAGKMRSSAKRIDSRRAIEMLEDVAAEQGVGYPLPGLYESANFSVPFTVGWSEPAIVLPGDWSEWDGFKLGAVLAHELTHVRRGDWPLSIAGSLNRALFWYLPQAWWLERHLANLAEEACDDAVARSSGDPRRYAAVVLDFAQAVSRPMPLSVSMARASQAGHRINRLLEARRPSRGAVPVTTWALLIAVSLPVVYAAAAFQVSAAVPQNVQKPAQTIGSPVPGATLTAAQAQLLENRLAKTPDDQETRAQLMGYYFSSSMPQPCATHLFWLVEHHPESTALDTYPAGIASRVGLVLTDEEELGRMAALWRRQAAANPSNLQVLAHAGHFLMWIAPEQAITLLSHARAMAPDQQRLLNDLVGIYSSQLFFLAPFPRPSGHRPDWSPEKQSIAEKLVAGLEASNDAELLGAAGEQAGREFQSSPPPQPQQPERVTDYVNAFNQFWAAHARKLLERAVRLEPANPRWARSLERILRASSAREQ